MPDSVLHIEPPELLLRGLVDLAKSSQVESIELPKRYTVGGQPVWAVEFTLKVDSHYPEMPNETRWFAVTGSDYPDWPVVVYPALEGGIQRTFPHQRYNTNCRENVPWRTGDLCLTDWAATFQQADAARPPDGSAVKLLDWHVRRTREWVERVAAGEVFPPNERFELPDIPDREARARCIFEFDQEDLITERRSAGSWGAARIVAARGICRTINFDFDSGSHAATGKTGENALWHISTAVPCLAPWHLPERLTELLERLAQATNKDLSDFREEFLVEALRYRARFLLIGVPIPETWRGTPVETHWFAVRLPFDYGQLPKRGPTKSFIKNQWLIDARKHCTSAKKIDWVPTRNVTEARLRARGSLNDDLRQSRVAIIGCGALGSHLASLLVRAGVRKLSLWDADTLEAGNLCRHVLTRSSVGQPKSAALAHYLQAISPSLQVEAQSHLLNCEKLNNEDIVIDCTASDSVLHQLRTQAGIPKVFVSASIVNGGQDLLVVGARTTRFDPAWVLDDIRSVANSPRVEMLEGPGCWSPTSRVRVDTVAFAAAAAARWLDDNFARLSNDPLACRFQELVEDGRFTGFARAKMSD